ncbi:MULTISPECIES: hypothetical protein [Pantoea]|uniref:Uncharacterized protein n=1 Tax=Pantoea brenneri TaxID=472694 RepID=A0ABU9MIG3_9GAMM|nr:hypothetical protein [Pantoea sp. 3.5.1]
MPLLLLLLLPLLPRVSLLPLLPRVSLLPLLPRLPLPLLLLLPLLSLLQYSSPPRLSLKSQFPLLLRRLLQLNGKTRGMRLA